MNSIKKFLKKWVKKMNYEKNKTKGIIILLAGIGILIYLIIPSIISPYSFLEFPTIFSLIFGILLLLIGRRFYMKPMEPIEGDKKLGHYMRIVGVLTFILGLIGFLIYFFIYPMMSEDLILIYNIGGIFELIELLLFGIALIFSGRFIMGPMEILDKKKKLGIMMFSIGIITLILSLISISIGLGMKIIIFIIPVGILLYGIFLILKTKIGITDIIMEVDEETKKWSKERILVELKDTKKKYQAYMKIGVIILLAGVGCFSTGLIPIFGVTLYGFIVAGIIIILISVPFFILYWKGHQRYNALKDTVDQKEQPPIVQTTQYLDELEKLKELHDKDIITKEEFEAKKKQLLGI